MSEVKPSPEKDERGRFLTGNIGGGRNKGSRNKLSEDFINDLYDHWKTHGIDAIDRVWVDRPHDYLKVVASILPSTLNVNVSAIESMSDDELNASIRRLFAEARDTIEGNPGSHAGEPNEPAKALEAE